MDESNKWRRKPRDSPSAVLPEPELKNQTKFSAELLELKAIMDAKLICQNAREHKVVDEKWMINKGGSRGRSSRDERYHPDVWRECNTCNV